MAPRREVLDRWFIARTDKRAFIGRGDIRDSDGCEPGRRERHGRRSACDLDARDSVALGRATACGRGSGHQNGAGRRQDFDTGGMRRVPAQYVTCGGRLWAWAMATLEDQAATDQDEFLWAGATVSGAFFLMGRRRFGQAGRFPRVTSACRDVNLCRAWFRSGAGSVSYSRSPARCIRVRTSKVPSSVVQATRPKSLGAYFAVREGPVRGALFIAGNALESAFASSCAARERRGRCPAGRGRRRRSDID